MDLSSQPVIDSFDVVFSRLADLTGKSSDAAIAREFGVSPQAIANARKKGSIPFDRVVKFAISAGISLDYLFCGIGSPMASKIEAALQGISHEIDLEVAEEVIRNIRIQIPKYFENPGTTPAIRLFPIIYNQICHLESKSDRALSIKKAVGMYLLNQADKFLKEVQGISTDEITDESKKTMTDSLEREKGRINEKYQLPGDASGTNANQAADSRAEQISEVTQNFNSDVGQAAAGNIIKNPKNGGNK